MNKHKLFLLCTLLPAIVYGKQSAVTYEKGSRLGDRLLAYAKAKYIARKYGLPFVLNHFKYIEELALYDIELRTHPAAKRVQVDCEGAVPLKADAGELYVFNYYGHVHDWSDWNKGLYLLKEDPAFIAELRRCIQPKKKLTLVEVPDTMITVALHVRKGGGRDRPLLHGRTIDAKTDRRKFIDYQFPLKFPPDDFYIEQLRKLSILYNDQPMYVHLFTDDQHPEQLAQRYQQALNKPNIHFGYRAKGNAHNVNVLEDLFSMTRFQCLIRGDSSYSKVAQLIGNFKVVMYPMSAIWEGNMLRIQKVAITIST